MKFNKPAAVFVKFGALAAAGCLWGSPGRALAGATANVNIGDDFFSPSAVTINVNDQVVWTWIGSFSHSTTESDVVPLWDSGIRGNGSVFTNVFTTAGSFPYHCRVHSFQLGTVTVQAAANVPPTVAITSPANNLVLSAPATFTLAANASDSDGSVTNVQFLRYSTSIGNFAASPWSMPVIGLPAGTWNFSAVASDNGGLTATNTITVQVVTPVPVLLSAPARTSATSFRFSYAANVGLKYVVQRSPDFSTWTSLVTNQAASNPVVFTDNAAPAGSAFYRVGRLPNP